MRSPKAGKCNIFLAKEKGKSDSLDYFCVW